MDALRAAGVLVKSPTLRAIAEEAPSADKDISKIIDVTKKAGRARRVARLRPLISVKG
ncbi:MAG: RtcB family protein [Gammaproteobacteria bacterium]|nr:RtcB family protein [Gammaproteobacteria bacterium]